MTGDTLYRRTERGGIIHYVGISPFNTQEIEMPQRTVIFGTTSGDLALGQIKLGPPLRQSQFYYLSKLSTLHSLLL